MTRSLGKVWRNPDGTECCGGPESRRHLCSYHEGYTDALDEVSEALIHVGPERLDTLRRRVANATPEELSLVTIDELCRRGLTGDA